MAKQATTPTKRKGTKNTNTIKMNATERRRKRRRRRRQIALFKMHTCAPTKE